MPSIISLKRTEERKGKVPTLVYYANTFIVLTRCHDTEDDLAVGCFILFGVWSLIEKKKRLTQLRHTSSNSQKRFCIEFRGGLWDFILGNGLERIFLPESEQYPHLSGRNPSRRKTSEFNTDFMCI